jgi:hypothetical protein
VTRREGFVDVAETEESGGFGLVGSYAFAAAVVVFFPDSLPFKFQIGRIHLACRSIKQGLFHTLKWDKKEKTDRVVGVTMPIHEYKCVNVSLLFHLFGLFGKEILQRSQKVQRAERYSVFLRQNIVQIASQQGKQEDLGNVDVEDNRKRVERVAKDIRESQRPDQWIKQ